MERLIVDKVQSYLTAENITSVDQYAFTAGRSCQSQLLKFSNEILKNTIDGNQVDVAYLDFSKAFDSVVHSKLIFKLKCIGIDGPPLLMDKIFF